MTDGKLLISENEVIILDDLLNRVKNTKYGLITNWDEPYGITFKELKRHIERIKYCEEYVRQKDGESFRRLEALYTQEKVACDMRKSAKIEEEKEYYKDELLKIRAEIDNLTACQ